jgi:1-acyl-sn-glycerol-3-phosphate acyltransferase
MQENRLNFFAGDSYHTPANTPRLLADRLLGGSQAYFVAKYTAIIAQARLAIMRGMNTPLARAQRAHQIFQLLEGCDGRFHLSGLDQVRHNREPLLIVSNHMSSMEGSIFPCLLAPLTPISFVIKESLLKYPIFGPVLASSKPIVVGRRNPREDLQTVMTQGQALLEQGVSVIIFPQSTRAVAFDPEQFNSLGVKLARKAGVRVMPVALKTDFWGNGKWVRDFGPLHRERPICFAFGEPIEVGSNGRSAHQQVVEFIQTHLNRWNSLEIGD